MIFRSIFGVPRVTHTHTHTGSPGSENNVAGSLMYSMYFPRVVVGMFSRRGNPMEPAGKKKMRLTVAILAIQTRPRKRATRDGARFRHFRVLALQTREETHP